MKEGLGLWFILIILLVISIPFGISSCNSSKADLIVSEARADAIRWEAQARASAITIAASTPIVVFGGVFIVSLAVVALAIVVVLKHKPTPPPPQIIERQIVYLPAPDQRRGDVWRQLSGSNTAALPPGNIVELDLPRQKYIRESR